jgi:hypothetical protein
MSATNGKHGKSFEKITDALQNHGSRVKPIGDLKAIAQCPAHDDGNPSLSLTWSGGDNPNTLIHCFAGCDGQDIMAALELRMSDLYDRTGTVSYAYTNPSGGWADRFVLRDPETKKFTQSIKKETDKHRSIAATYSTRHATKTNPSIGSKARRMWTHWHISATAPPPHR